MTTKRLERDQPRRVTVRVEPPAAHTTPELDNEGLVRLEVARGLVGAQLGRWELRELIGQGAMGAVFRAEAEGEPEVAIKVILPALSEAEDYLPRFRQEARVTRALDHPNVVRYIDHSDIPLPHLVLEYIEGRSLRAVLQERRRLTIKEVLRAGRQILEALGHAHARGVVHRDLKPANIMVRSRDGALVVTDFGLGRELGDDGRRLTLTGQIMGTPHYIAPEQIASTKGAGAPSDFYALGIILFHMLAGRPPYSGGQYEVILGHKQEPLPDVRIWRPEVPKPLSALLARLTLKRPEDRFADAAQARAALEAIVLERPAPRLSFSLLGELGPGERLGGWTLGERLGSGGAATVFQARRGAVLAAVKVLSPGKDSESAARRFEREVQLLGRLRHPNIVKVIDAGRAPFRGRELVYLAMELAREDLGRRVERTGPLPCEQAVSAALGVARGLAEAHRRGILHRDVKPENILVRGEHIDAHAVCLTDFGIAAGLRDDESAPRSGGLGSPVFMAPEQARSVATDERSDIYALGATLYYLLTGARLFAADNVEGLVLAHARLLPTRADKLSASVPKEVALIVDRAVLKRPADRYQTVEDLAEDLRAYLAGRLSPARVQAIKAAVARGRRPFERRPLRLSLLTVCALVLLGALLAWRVGRSARDPLAAAAVLLSEASRQLPEAESAADPGRFAGIAERLQSARESAGELTGGPPPDDFLAELLRARQAGAAAAARAALAVLAERERRPLDAELEAELQRARAIAKLAAALLGADPAPPAIAETLAEYRRRLTQWEAAEALRRLVDDARGEASLEARLRALEEARSSVAAYAAARGEGDPMARKVLAYSENLGDRIREDRAVLGPIQARLAALEARLEADLRGKDPLSLAKVQKELADFLESLEAGVPELRARALALQARRIDLNPARARQRIDQFRSRAREGRGFDSVLAELAGLGDDYPAGLYPAVAAEVRALRERVEGERDASAERAFDELCRRQDAELDASAPDKASFDRLFEQVSGFAETGEHQGWRELKPRRERRRAALGSRRDRFGRELLDRAEAALTGPRARGSAAFTAALKRARRACAAAGRFVDHEPDRRARLLSTLALLEELHAPTAMASLAPGAVTLGRTEPGFPHSPAYRARLRPYRIDKVEVRVRDYAAFLAFLEVVGHEKLAWCPAGGTTPAHRPQSWEEQARHPEHPVRGLSQQDARAFALFAGKRLPSEAEWEAAARRGPGRADGPFAWGAGPVSAERCAFLELIDRPGGPSGVEGQRQGATRDGLLNMTGNVAEWTASPLAAYPGGDPRDLLGLAARGLVVRGGSFRSEAIELPVWRRSALAPLATADDVGFRCACDP